jgi:osmoprotectant transport system ATP-binding protein
VSAPEATVELRGVARRFAGGGGLQPTTLTLTPGATTVLLGPSGCGKSTLLRLVNGLLRPDAGEVRVFDTPVRDDTAPALRRRMGYVIQDGGLFPHLTGLGNVALLPTWLGWDAARIRDRAHALCALARLPTELLDRYPQSLSGGQRQRVALVRALMTDPALLLLDEPLGALDPMVRAELQRDLRDAFAALGKTVILVTHDLGEASHFARDVVLLRDGVVLQHGPLDALERAPADPFVTRFLSAQKSLWGAP